MVKKYSRKEHILLIGFSTIIFLSMLLFFLRIHPLIIYDADDWLYASYFRLPIPIWHDWNPSRVFPEIFMPLCSTLAVYLFMPLTHDYIWSLALMYGIVVSFFIALYVSAFALFLREKMKASVSNSVIISTFFFLFHFLIFKTSESGNHHMFYANDVTCYFYYIIPTILNIVLVIILELYPDLMDIFSRKNGILKGVISFSVYMAIFSNMFCSVIIAVWAGVEIINSSLNLISCKDFKFKTILRNNIYKVMIVLGWLISIIYELSGGRAESLAGISFAESVKHTIRNFTQVLIGVNKYVAVLLVCVIILYFMLIPNKKQARYILIALANAAIIGAFLILACAKSNAYYITRTEILLALCFWVFAAIGIMMTALINNKAIRILSPCILLLLYASINSHGITFADANCGEVDWKTCYDISSDFVEQIEVADDDNKMNIVLKVPQYDDAQNWPLAIYGEDRICYTLYKHGIVSHDLNVVFEPDNSINQKWGITS